MKRALFLLLLVAAVPVAAQRGGSGLRPAANPSALIAAELAFARLAQDKGQWTAYAQTAAADAEIIPAERISEPRLSAQAFLKDRANPPVARTWQPHAVFASCDGSFAITRGAWQIGGANPAKGSGWFSNVWQRQAKGGYRWVLAQDSAMTAPDAAPDFITGTVADCQKRPEPSDVMAEDDKAQPMAVRPKKNALVPQMPLAGVLPPFAVPAGAESRDARSNDGTLAWRTTMMADGARDYTVWIWKDGAMLEVIRAHAAPLARG